MSSSKRPASAADRPAASDGINAQGSGEHASEQSVPSVDELQARIAELEQELIESRAELASTRSAVAWRLANRVNEVRRGAPLLAPVHSGLKGALDLLLAVESVPMLPQVRSLGALRPSRARVQTHWRRFAALPPVEQIKDLLPESARRSIREGVLSFLSTQVAQQQTKESDYLDTTANIRAMCERDSGSLRARHAKQFAELSSRARDTKGVVIYLPTVRWGYLFQRPQQLMRQLARKGYLCVFCTPLPEDDGVSGFKEVEPNLFLCSDVRLVLDIENPILWLNWPVNRAYLPFFKKPRVVYEFIDELDVFHLYCQHMERDHEEIVKSADVVVATADKLLERLKAFREDAILAPNGVEPGDFVAAEAPVPEDLAPILARGKPIVGYYGALAEWMDYELLNRASAEAPDLSFLLIGPDYDGSSSRLVRRPNVFVLGAKDYSELRHYSTRFDVATIPFQLNEITRSTSPVKLFEYMAAGAPIVTTAMHECMKYGSVMIANDSAEYVSMLRKAIELRGNAAYQQDLRRDVLENTWSKRVDDIVARFEQVTAQRAEA